VGRSAPRSAQPSTLLRARSTVSSGRQDSQYPQLHPSRTGSEFKFLLGPAAPGRTHDNADSLEIGGHDDSRPAQDPQLPELWLQKQRKVHCNKHSEGALAAVLAFARAVVEYAPDDLLSDKLQRSQAGAQNSFCS